MFCWVFFCVVLVMVSCCSESRIWKVNVMASFLTYAFVFVFAFDVSYVCLFEILLIYCLLWFVYTWTLKISGVLFSYAIILSCLWKIMKGYGFVCCKSCVSLWWVFLGKISLNNVDSLFLNETYNYWLEILRIVRSFR